MRKIIRAFVAAAFSCLAGSAVAQQAEITPPQARALAAEGKLLLIDVRTPAEWRETGVPAGARLINLRQSGFVDQVLRAVGNDKAAPIGVICRSGSRSAQAQALLQAEGFTNVVNVSHGVLGGQGWLQAGLPLEPCPTC